MASRRSSLALGCKLPCVILSIIYFMSRIIQLSFIPEKVRRPVEEAPIPPNTLWKDAERIVWEGEMLDGELFSLIPMMRWNLRTGAKISSLLSGHVPEIEWKKYIPNIQPWILEKRKTQARLIGTTYFIEGLKCLFDVELLSRGGSESPDALLTLFQAKLRSFRKK